MGAAKAAKFFVSRNRVAFSPGPVVFLDRSTNWELKILPQVESMVRRAR
jgi:hypothetical protein